MKFDARGRLQRENNWELLYNVPQNIQDVEALPDPGADAVLGWDDSAGAIEYLSAGEVGNIVNSVLDHGLLQGLADNDHPQYPLKAGTETISGAWTFAATGAGASSAIRLSAADPTLSWNETDAGTDVKNWDIIPAAGLLRFRLVNDANSVVTNWLTVERTTTTVNAVRLPNDNEELTLGAGNDLRLYHDGTNSIIRNDTGELRLNLSTQNRVAIQSAATVINVATARGGGQNYLDFFDPTGGKGYIGYAGSDDEFYVNNRLNTGIHFGVNNTEVLHITNAGELQILRDNDELQIGAGQDLRLYHDGTNSFITNATGELVIGKGTGLDTDYVLFNARSLNSTAANNVGLYASAHPSATAANRHVYLLWDADGANAGGGDYFYIQKFGNSGAVRFIQQSNSGMEFYTNGTLRAEITSDGRIYGAALHNNAGAVTGPTNQYIASGTYTPTLTNVTNVSASTAFAAQWLRVGNVVTVSGILEVDPTAAGATELGISLPIASALTAAGQLGGVGSAPLVTTNSMGIFADAPNDRASMQWVAIDLTNQTVTFTFTYVVL